MRRDSLQSNGNCYLPETSDCKNNDHSRQTVRDGNSSSENIRFRSSRGSSATPPVKDVTSPSPSISTTTGDQSFSSTAVSNDATSPADSGEDVKSVSRDFAPIFFILVILSILVLLGLISTFYNRRGSLFRHPRRRNTNLIYSPLTSANDFDLN